MVEERGRDWTKIMCEGPMDMDNSVEVTVGAEGGMD